MQLTYLDHEQFSRIKQKELFVASSEDSSLSPTVTAIAQRFNQVTLIFFYCSHNCFFNQLP